MTSNLKKLSLILIFFSAVACQRAAEEKSTITISLPPSEKLGAFACSTCLKFMAVNISGEGIPSVIYAKKEHGDFSEAGTELTPEIEIEVPVGKQRFFQVFAAYSSSSDDIEIKYGTATADLAGATSLVPMTISSLGQFEGGHITGRYLTGNNVGPTGVVNINIVPEPGKPEFTFLKSYIYNGWFDFFASKNFEISYKVEGGDSLLSNIRLDQDFLPADVASNPQIARVVRPASYFQLISGGGGWEQKDEDDTDLVMGFFFAPGVIDANKKVCKDTSVTALNRISSNISGTPLMQYDPSGSSGDVRVYGGVNFCGSAQQYNIDEITLNAEQFNGLGNNSAKSMIGAFTFFNNLGQIKKYTKTLSPTFTYSFRFLPHLVGSQYDGAKLYRISSEPASHDDLSCDSASLSAQGFAEVPLVSTSFDLNKITLTTSSAITGYGMICPTKAGELRGFGGMYLGNLL